jgi:hypothetical protein
MSDELRVYYLRGWIRPGGMDNPGWFDSWYQTAKEEIALGRELVVFSIPANNIGTADPETICDIERMLQDRFGIPKK